MLIELLALPSETEGVEWKHNNDYPEMIAERLSVLANWAWYEHACLCFVSVSRMTNPTLRQRFGIETKNASQASRLIKEALAAGVIKMFDPDVRDRDRSYLPFWA